VHGVVGRGSGAAGIEEADEHGWPQSVRLMRERNSRRSVGSLRNEPRITLFTILVLSSLTPASACRSDRLP